MTTNGLIHDCVIWMIRNFGYVTVIKLKDVLLYASGVALGVLITVMLIGRIFHRVEKVENLGRATSVRFKHEGETHYFIQVHNFYEAVEFLLVMAFKPVLHKHEYTLEDEKRARRFVYFVLAVIIVFIVIGVMLISNPILLPKYLPPELQKKI